MGILTINGIDVHLGDNEGIRLTRGNTIIGGKDSFTLPIELLLKDPANAKAIDYLHHLAIKGSRNRTFPAKYESCGVPLIDGTATILEINDTIVELVIKGNTLNFWDTIASKDMSVLNFPEIVPFNASSRTLSGVMAELNSTLTQEKDYVCFELINDPDVRPAAADVTSINPAGMFNFWDLETQSFINETGDADGAGGYKYNNNVFIRLHAALRCIFEALGYTVEYNYFAEDWCKDIVLINVCNLWAKSGTLTYADFLPSGTVYNFLDQLRESGIYFSVDTAGGKVSINTIEEMMTASPVQMSNVITGTKKISPSETIDGYRISMQKRGAWNEEAIEGTLDSADKYLYYLSYRTFNDLPRLDPSDHIGALRGVRSEGMIYEYISDNQWKRRCGFTQDESDGEDVVIDSPISAAMCFTTTYQKTTIEAASQTTYTKNWGPAYIRQRTIVNYNSDSDETIAEAIILTVFRGMDDCQTDYTNMIEENDPVISPSYPRAMYLSINTVGTYGALLDSTICSYYIKQLAQAKINLLKNSYPLEYQYLGQLPDMLNSNFLPVLIEGQKAFIKQRSAKIIDGSKNFRITDTVYVEQVTD